MSTDLWGDTIDPAYAQGELGGPVLSVGRACPKGIVKLTAKEWRAIREWFRAEEAILRNSYGEPGDKARTYRKHYAEALPTESALYEAAREVFGEQP